MAAIEERLNAELTRALKAGDRGVVDAVRMVKARIVERAKSPGFQGPMTDRVEVEVVAAYVKSLRKAVDEISAGGGGDRPILEKYRFEIEYLTGYLPKTLSEDETRALVRETVASLGVSGPSAVGRVMGAIMKAHKDEVDSSLVKRVVEEELTRPPA
jgi:uncharacterized protein YqeY